MAEMIYKYKLEMVYQQMLRMPEGAKILTLQMQHGTPCLCLWARVDPEQPLEDRVFITIGTGHEIPGDARTYIGTYQDGMFVFHVFGQ